MDAPPPEDDEVLAALPEDFGTLIRGAIDLHVHGQPDLSRQLPHRGPDRAVARLASRYGMSGWVLKSHLWPTMDRAGLLREDLDDGFTVYGSITLNPPVGGLDPAVVELAAAHGASVVFLPTWGHTDDLARRGYITTLLERISPAFPGYAAENAVRLLDQGRLSGRTRDVIDACRGLGLTVATGHAPAAESLAVAEYCADIAAPLLVTHPLHYVDTPAQLREFADRGAFVEFAAAPLLHPDGHLTVRDVYAGIDVVGASRAVLTTDVFSRWVPPEPECLRMFAEQLAYLGATPDELHQMLVVNPRRLLRIEEGDPSVSTRSELASPAVANEGQTR